MMKPHAPGSKSILQSLRRAVSHALERKRRLGQYDVIWEDGQAKTIRPGTPDKASLVHENPTPYAPKKTQYLN